MPAQPLTMPQRPTSPLFSQPATAAPPAARKLPPELEELKSKLEEQTGDIASRLRVVEQRIDNLRSHLELIDSSLIEKHKAVISDIRDGQDSMRTLRADIDFVKELAGRLAKRLEDLASREEVKVLQRYVELWQPLQFVTRSEVKTLVQNILKEQGLKMKE